MPDLALAIRLADRLTHRCQVFNMPASWTCGNHLWDVIQVLPGDHVFSAQERKEYGILIVTDVPEKDVATVTERLTEGTTYIGDDGGERQDRPRIIQIPVALLKTASPLTKDLDDVYDEKKLVEKPPSIPWSELKEALWNKVTQSKPDLTAVRDG